MSLAIVTRGRISTGGVDRIVIQREYIVDIVSIVENEEQIGYQVESIDNIYGSITEESIIGYSIETIDGASGVIGDFDDVSGDVD